MSTEPPRNSTNRLLAGPILPTLMHLAAPNLVMVAVQLGAVSAKAYYVGRLGTEALAGVSLVLPLFMLMQMMSAGAMGGGISSAVARALGAGRRDEAEALALHALVIALGLGAVFTLGALLGGPVLYRAMGGSGPPLAAALAYSNVVFGGAVASLLNRGRAVLPRRRHPPRRWRAGAT